MSLKTWGLLFVSILIILFLFSGFLINKNKSVDFKNINKQSLMKIESDAFINNSNIPVEYTCNGKYTRVPLKISDVPEGVKSLALIVDDPDAPGGDFVHWIVWNIDPRMSVIENTDKLGGATEGYTSMNKPGWIAPCPPYGVHHYNFKLYALDTLISLEKFSTKADLIPAMEGHIIDSATFVGLYSKK